jgi:hypothetical protein
MNAGALNHLELLRRTLLGQLQTADVNLRAGLHQHGMDVLMLLSVSVVSTVSIFCFLGCVADSFNDTTILSSALLLNCELSGRSLANIEQNHCHRRHLTQKHADFTRGDLAVFKLRRRFHSMFARVKNSLSFFHWRRQLWRFRRTFNQPPTPSDHFFQVSAGAEPTE